MGRKHVQYFDEINKSSLASVGGKGANLGELFYVPGIQVPMGFCITTTAYHDFVSTSPEFGNLVSSLDRINAGSIEEVRGAGEKIRLHLESLEIPIPIREEIIKAWRQMGAEYPYAVRSSATAEDLPGASFAGQQETFLNVKGQDDLLSCVRKCWASLFTDRAIIYRQQNRFSHGKVYLAVVVQRMVFPEVSGIMFTADPVTGNRKIVSIDASFGLGEALVSGIVSADLYQVRSDKLIKKQIAKKKTGIYAKSEGGTAQVEIKGERQTAPALSDEQAVRLARMGRSIEEHFGSPQDIEWCLVGDEIFIVQSRPITTLYPVPSVADDKLHLFISIGHPQMMTEAMKPLGIVQYMAAAIITYKLIESLSKKWLGDAAELRSISKSPQGNVTSEMGLALGDVADAVRNHPVVIEYLEHAADETFFDGLRAVPGGEDVLPVFLDFFERYGMRGTGEIDVSRPRWRETPTQLVPAILSHIKGVRPGQHRLDFLAGKEEAELAAERLLERLRKTSGGFFKAKRMQRLIKVHRSLIGIREHPKYFIVQNLDIIKQAILQEAAKLVAAGILESPEEVFWFSLQEIKEMIETQWVDRNLIIRRKEKFQQDEKLTPPRTMTSEGEIITAKPGAHVPPGALAGSPVSAGTVEGRARVILKLEEAKMDKGDILVAPYTDPAWTPLFPLAAGLVTEVGGLMTHGAVVAREYGIPAVVGVDNATRKIQDGQKIHVDGTQGFVEILE